MAYALSSHTWETFLKKQLPRRKSPLCEREAFTNAADTNTDLEYFSKQIIVKGGGMSLLTGTAPLSLPTVLRHAGKKSGRPFRKSCYPQNGRVVL
jgi:hypothetical protein